MYSRFCPELSQKGMEKLQRMTTSAGGEVEVEKQSDLKENKRFVRCGFDMTLIVPN